MIRDLSEIETSYLKRDKPIPQELSKRIKKILMVRQTKPLRFSHFIKSVNTRFSNLDNIVCSDIQYTPYEQALYNLCNKFDIDVTYTVVDKKQDVEKCLLNITFDIQQKNLSCDLLSSLSVTQVIQKKCDPKVTVKISEEQCSEYYNELIQHKSCNYSYDQYKNLLSLGFLPKTIDYALKSEAYISPDGKYLTTKTNNYELFKDLCFNSISTEGIENIDIFLSDVVTDLPAKLKEEILKSYRK